MDTKIQKTISNGISNIKINNPLKTSRVNYVQVFLLFIVIGLFFWFIVQPKRSDLATQQARLDQLTVEKDSLSNNLKKLKALIATMKKSDVELAKLDEALPLEGKSARLNMLLESLAASSGVTIGDIGVAGDEGKLVAGDVEVLERPFSQKRSIRKQVASVYIIGSLDQIETFIKKVENNARVMDITSLDISSGPEDNTLNLKLSINAYSYEQ